MLTKEEKELILVLVFESLLRGRSFILSMEDTFLGGVGVGSTRKRKSLPYERSLNEAAFGVYKPSNVEYKFFDFSKGSTAVSTSGIVDNLNLVVQGNGESERIGRKITIRRVVVRGATRSLDTDADAGGGYARFILFVDKQCNGATISVTDLLEDANVLSFYNLRNDKRFNIISDLLVPCNATAGFHDGVNGHWNRAHYPIFYYYDVNIPIDFSAAAAAITSITSNNLAMLVIGGQEGRYLYRTRIRYSDE